MTGTEPILRKGHGLALQPRDLELLRELGIMRVADREQVKVAAGFHSTTRVNTRLLALTRAGLLRRFFLGFSGARKALYALSQKGARAAEVPCRGPRRPQETMLVADYFTEHQLAINALYCALKHRTAAVGEPQCLHWKYFSEPVAPGVNLIPDGYVEFATRSGNDASFIEVDLGHESLGIWKEKAKRYLQLAITGEFQKQFGQRRFRVLVLAHSERKRDSIRAAVAQVTEKIFWFATQGAAAKNPFAPVWLRPRGNEPTPLFETIP